MDNPSLAVLVLAPNTWQGQWVNRQQLFSRLGRQWRVLYCTGNWSSWQRHEAGWRRAPLGGAMLPMDHVTVDQAPRWMLRNPRWGWWDRWMVRLQSMRWRRFLAPGKGTPLVAYVFHPMFLPYVRCLGADYLVYHAYDRYEHTPGWTAELAAAERSLLEQADLVLASSEQIAGALHAKVARPVLVLPNGADAAAFARARAGQEEPPDLRAIPGPRLGWIGSLHPSVDFGLIAALARRHPEWHFVLLGQLVAHREVASQLGVAACKALPNVHFLGARPVEEVPAYVVHMDVNLMAYRVDGESWVLSGYPLKLHEYLAAGHPVVSADLPSVRPFAGVLSIAHGVDEWEAALAAALADGGGQAAAAERIAVADANSWDSRAQALAGWLQQLTGAGGVLAKE